MMRVLITRPLEDALPLAESLRALGVEPVIEPVLTIHPIAGKELELEGVQAVLATSTNGVRVLAEVSTRRDPTLFAVGNATAEAAREAGFEFVESAAGDVDTLARLVRERLNTDDGPLLHVTGSEVAGDLGAALEAAGFAYKRAVIYEAREAKRLSPETVRMLRDGEIDGVSLFSPRTAAVFLSLARKDRLVRRCKSMAAFCLSPAVAKEAQRVPWKETVTSLHPDRDSLVSSVCDYGRRAGLLDAAPTAPVEPGPAAPDEPAAAAAERPAPAAQARQPQGDVPPRAAERPRATGTSDVPLLHVPSAVYVATTVFLWTLMALAVIGGVLYASRTFWMPYAEAYVQSFNGPRNEEERLAGLSDRLAEVERLAKARQEERTGLKDLEAERARFREELERLIHRVGALEGQFVAVKDSIDTTTLTSQTAETKESIRALTERLALLEQKDATPRSAEEIERLESESEKLNAAMVDLTGRLDALEKRDVVSAETVRELRETVRVAEGLRLALRDGKPFVAELKALREAAPGKPVVAEAAVLIEAFATKGVPTLAQLRERFDLVARNVKRASMSVEGEGWWSHVIDRLSALMTIRRTDVAADTGGIDGALAVAERALAAGDLPSAVGALESLKGLTAAAAAPWLGDAKARLAAERAMVILHAHVVSATDKVDE